MRCIHPILVLAITVFSEFVHGQNDTESALFNLPPGTNLTTIHILDDHGERNIAYYVSGGFAIVDGDIAYGTEAELLARVVPEGGTVSRRPPDRHPLDSRAHSIFPNGRKWPGANVIYKYDSADTEMKVSGFIDEGIRRWKAKNPFLQFTKVSPPNSASVAGTLTVKAIECGGCYASVVGYSSNANLVLNLQQRCGNENVRCVKSEATHELGHVLGLVHEVKRPDSNQHVIFHCENLEDFHTYKNPKICCTTKCCGQACQFTPDDSFDHSGPYRVTSIMHYRANAFVPKGSGLISLEGIAPDVVPSFNLPHPDIVDHERICNIYSEECKGVCGNGILEVANGEECDDGNDNNFDTCSNDCKKISVCGNGILEPPEECDDGNLIDGDGCTSTCKIQVCGNGILEPGEECDDGNLIDGDGCTSTCKKQVCGNGVVEPGEECDDGNTVDNDGCSSTCKHEPLCVTCNPTSGLNKCDISTSCITTFPSGEHHCGCRAGFKADALDSQIATHYRLSFPGQEYRVFVAPGVECNTLCDNPFGAPQDICNEVPVDTECN